MKKKSKISHPTISKDKEEPKDISHKKHFYDEYFDLFFFKMKPIPEIFLERLAAELKKCCEDDNFLRMDQFYLPRHMTGKDYNRFVSRNKCLAAAHEYALNKIAQRREIGALKNQFNANVVFKSQAFYDPIYKQQMEWQSSLRQAEKEVEGKQTIVVNMKEFKSDMP